MATGTFNDPHAALVAAVRAFPPADAAQNPAAHAAAARVVIDAFFAASQRTANLIDALDGIEANTRLTDDEREEAYAAASEWHRLWSALAVRVDELRGVPADQRDTGREVDLARDIASAIPALFPEQQKAKPPHPEG